MLRTSLPSLLAKLRTATRSPSRTKVMFFLVYGNQTTYDNPDVSLVSIETKTPTGCSLNSAILLSPTQSIPNLPEGLGKRSGPESPFAGVKETDYTSLHRLRSPICLVKRFGVSKGFRIVIPHEHCEHIHGQLLQAART